MNDVDYINYILQKKEYLNIQDYIDRRSNEILSDDVWLWRVKAGVEGDFPDLNPQDLADLLKKIILEIIHKGGVPIDYYRSDINDLINKSKHCPDELSNTLVTFTMDNPDDGNDGNGIWFE
jgi:hypothetical protein